MFIRSVAFLTALAAVAHAQIEPGVGTTFKAGSDCTVEWKVDPTGTWKKMYIELMSGDNFHMNHITTAGTVDGTDPTKASFTWTCPELDPYSEIYFYQFSSPASKQPIWTTRFLITDKDGNFVPPPNPTQPDGKPIGWGVGKLVDPSTAVAAPTDVGSQASSTASGSSSGSAIGSASASASDSSAPVATSEPASVPVSSAPVSTKPATAAPVSTSGMVKTSSSAITKTSASSAAVGNATTSNTTGENGASAVAPAARAATLLALLGVAVAVLL